MVPPEDWPWILIRDPEEYEEWFETTLSNFRSALNNPTILFATSYDAPVRFPCMFLHRISGEDPVRIHFTVVYPADVVIFSEALGLKYCPETGDVSFQHLH